MNKKIPYAFIISFVLLTVVIILNRRTFREMRNYTNAVDHTREVINYFERISNHFKSAQIYTTTYSNIAENKFYTLYKKDADSIPAELKQLHLLVRDNAGQAKLVDSISNMIVGQLGTLMEKNVAEIIQADESWRLNYLFTIHEMINRGIGSETDLLAQRKQELKESTSLTNLLTTGFAFVAVAIIVFYFFSNLFITRKRQWLEGFLESILNTSQNGIIHYKTVREEGKIINFKYEFVNKSIENLLGIKPELVMGKRLKDISSFGEDDELFDRYVQVVNTGQSSIFETFYSHHVQKWFLVSLVKLEDGLTASFQDITQLKKYEEELKNNIAQLERSNNELEQYAYVASHDLQEPLRKIRSFGSYLQETQGYRLDEKGRQQLDKIMKSAERMSVLIKDILSFSSLRKEDFVETDLTKILETVLADFDLSISQKGAVVKHDILPVIDAIPLQMNQLFYNLINNSLKFAKEDKKPIICISSQEASYDKKARLGLPKDLLYYEIVFEDNGIGFSQEYADQIFGLFKRLNDKQFYPGSGIGLALCKKVVDNHEGLIYAEGIENEGARFFIYLPKQHR